MKKDNNVYQYLEASGILEHGTSEEISAVRRAYWKEYKRKWNKGKRAASKSFTIQFTPSEATAIVAIAHKHHVSPTNFIKRTALTTQSILDPFVIGQIRELLALHYATLQALIEDNTIPDRVGDTLMTQIENIERQILNFIHPLKT